MIQQLHPKISRPSFTHKQVPAFLGEAISEFEIHVIFTRWIIIYSE